MFDAAIEKAFIATISAAGLAALFVTCHTILSI
jgi:hypothetical protein